MLKTPMAAPQTEGRILGKDWSIANVARLLRSNAGRGVWNGSYVTGGSVAEGNRYYLRKVSAKHLPTGVSVIFMRLAEPDCWYASLCFSHEGAYLPWNSVIAERWLQALFGEDRLRVLEAGDENGYVRQFVLPVTA
jgi:hypothetical protein